MRRRLITKVGLYPLVAAGTFLAFGAVTESAVASPPAVSVAGPWCDCGKDDEDHDHAAHEAEGGHAEHSTEHGTGHGDEHGAGPVDDHGDGHGTEHGEESDGSHGGGHDSHGSGSVASAPDDATRNLVLGGFAGVNAAVLGGAGLVRRRTASRRERHEAARVNARPARRNVAGDER